MNYFYLFIIENFVVLCVAIVLSITLIRKLKTHKRTSIYLLIILGLTLLLSIFDVLQKYVEYGLSSILGTTIFASVLYIIRPVCLLCFIFLSGQEFKGKWFYILLVPLTINIITNLFPFFESTKTWSFYYDISPADGKVHWIGGEIKIFRFMPHIVSIFYLIFLLYKSVRLLQSKHFTDAAGIFVCAAVVSLATVVETFFNDSGDLNILPSSIAVSTVFYYLFLYERNNKMDVLTGLFNRTTFFDDFLKFEKDITGIVQLDMNGLKYLNDNFGHLEGDKGLKTIAEAITNNATRRMYSYRLGGDEFIVLGINETDEKMKDFISKFKEEIKNSKYYCSIGYAYKDKKTTGVEKMLKISEERMYLDKAEFYKTAKIDRRKSSYVTEE